MEDNKKKQNVDSTTIEIIKEFVSEAYFLLDDAERELDKLETNYDKNSIDKIFRLFHSLKGSASFLNFENIKNITHNAENILDIYRDRKMKPNTSDIDFFYNIFNIMNDMIDNVSNNYTDEGFEEQSNKIIDGLHEIKQRLLSDIDQYLEHAKNILDRIENSLKNKINENNVDKDFILDIIRRTYIAAEAVELLDITSDNEHDQFKIKTLLENILNEKIEFNNRTFNALLKNFYFQKQTILYDSSKKTDNSGENVLPIGEILIDLGLINDKDMKKALELQEISRRKEEKEEPLLTQSFRVSRDEFRIDLNKVNMLFNAIGELSISGELINGFFKNTSINNQNKSKMVMDTFNKNLNDIQNIILSIRTISMENFFNKMKRLVKQESNKLKKNVNFDTKGASTEIDKNLIDEITSPIIHLLRNAIDHGIENEEIRKTKNKPTEGHLELIAKQEGSEIWITVRDDGKGIDKDTVLKVAKEAGLINENIEMLSDNDVWDILSSPGFSTNEDISDISGRGVGLDVVRKTLEKVNGNVIINNKKDIGTEITIKIPITMEIVKVITFDINNYKYSIPTRDILETIAINKKNLVMIDEHSLNFRLRDEIIPLIFIDKISKDGIPENISVLNMIQKEMMENKKGFVMVLKKHNRKFGLYVNKIQNIQRTVVKPLPEYIKNNNDNFIFGCTIFGNGEISFIIDTGKLLSKTFELRLSSKN